MELDLRSIGEVLAGLERETPSGMRFQVICPGCQKPVWTSQDKIGDKMICTDCDNAITVIAPDDWKAPGSRLALIKGESQEYPSPYTIVESLDLSPRSSLTDMLMAFQNTDEQAEALRLLRDSGRRLAHDLLCFPCWEREDTPHGSK